MKLIVGLGNPGAQYERTRHNAGFMAVDVLAERHARGAVPRSRFNALTLEASLPGSAGPEKCLLMKPTTYMNRSGQSVAEAVRFFRITPASDMLVIVDDVYLPCGTIRIRENGSAGGHNGLADIERLLGSDVYPRVRVGVDPPGQIPQADYVLGRFTDEQWSAVNEAITRSADAAELFVRSGLTAAMNRFNGKGPDQHQKKKEVRAQGPSGPAVLGGGPPNTPGVARSSEQSPTTERSS